MLFINTCIEILFGRIKCVRQTLPPLPCPFAAEPTWHPTALPVPSRH